MTSEQPKEYIITAFQLKQLQEYADLDFVCQAIRSRPHPAPATEAQQRICENAILKISGTGGHWVMCTEVVGSCEWICDNHKCPKAIALLQAGESP